ncbi:MAG: outer membrane protein assembly factor BamE [Bdellovibrionales bacterium]|nr:outer membrane protein assembly factor BamE [Bdellovibrionales bacterium]
MKLFKFLLLLGTLLMISCQTNMVKEFNSLKVGDGKDQVLDKLGSPRHMMRTNGEDHWYYLFYSSDNIRQQKEVHFKDGLVTYFGDKIIPPTDKTPEAIDAKNEEENRKIELESQARAEASKNAYLDYLKYEKTVKKQDQVDYMPDFEPVR